LGSILGHVLLGIEEWRFVMTEQKKNTNDIPQELPKKGPLSFFLGAITSGLLAWLSLGLSQRIVSYFTYHQPSYNSAIAQSISSAFKTLIVGMSFLATFSFSFIGLGLTIVFLRSLFNDNRENPA